MPRIVLYTAVTVVFLLYSQAEAANTINWTFYGPGAAGWMQGPMTASQKDFEGSSNGIHTLDDVRTGKSKYVTLASATVMKGRFYCIGTVTYTSPPANGGDGKTHTLENVVGYVHDTGCAFNGTCSCARLPQFCDGKPRTDKMDIAVGNFNGFSAEYAMNYITKNPNRAPATWTQIAGLPAQGSAQSAVSPCGGVAKETGTPVSAPYTPPPTFAPQNPLQQQVPAPQQPNQSYQTSSYQPQPIPSSVPTGSGAGRDGSLYASGPVPTQPLSYPQPTTAINGAVLTTTLAQPTPVGVQSTGTTQSTGLLSSLFQQTSATSDIRVLQNVAQTVTNLFVMPTRSAVDDGVPPAQSTPLPGSAPAQPVIVNDTNNISLMTLSQTVEMTETETSTDSAQRLSDETPRPNNPVLAAMSQQPSTFDAHTFVQANDTETTQTVAVFQTVLTAFRVLLQSIVSVLTGR